MRQLRMKQDDLHCTDAQWPGLFSNGYFIFPDSHILKHKAPLRVRHFSLSQTGISPTLSQAEKCAIHPLELQPGEYLKKSDHAFVLTKHMEGAAAKRALSLKVHRFTGPGKLVIYAQVRYLAPVLSDKAGGFTFHAGTSLNPITIRKNGAFWGVLMPMRMDEEAVRVDA